MEQHGTQRIITADSNIKLTGQSSEQHAKNAQRNCRSDDRLEFGVSASKCSVKLKSEVDCSVFG